MRNKLESNFIINEPDIIIRLEGLNMFKAQRCQLKVSVLLELVCWNRKIKKKDKGLATKSFLKGAFGFIMEQNAVQKSKLRLPAN